MLMDSAKISFEESVAYETFTNAIDINNADAIILIVFILSSFISLSYSFNGFSVTPLHLEKGKIHT